MKNLSVRTCTLALPLIIAANLGLANAAESSAYQHEISIGALAHSDEWSDEVWAVDYTYYLAPVKIRNRPYALYDFFHQDSKLNAAYSRYDGNNGYGIGGRYALANNWYVDAAYSRGSTDQTDNNSWLIGGGYFLNATTEIYSNYARSNLSFDGDSFNQDGDLTNDSFTIGAKSFLEVNITKGIMLEANYVRQMYDSKLDNDSDNIFNVAADWYLTNSWSVGLEHIRDSDDNYTQIGTAYSYRFANNFYFTGEVTRAIDSDASGVVAGLTLTGRF